VILSGEDADEFRRQLDEEFPRPDRGAARRPIMGVPYDPETGEPLLPPPGDSVKEG
jgi:hypothetical protein